MNEGYQREQNCWKITANHEIQGVTAKMIDWWWDHIDTSERYKLWHPTDHVSFAWIIPPSQHGHVGAVQRVEEFTNGKPERPLSLEIRWEDPAQAEGAEYTHVLLASGKGAGGLLDARLMHEYEDRPEGGVRMRSHFWMSSGAPEEAVQALYEHNKQEMQNFSVFLPGLYEQDVVIPAHLGKA